MPLGWRYELAASPEGLDGFLTRLALEAVKGSDDARRVRLLRVWGVEALLLERPLAAGVDGVRLVTTTRGPLAEVLLYRIEGATPELRRVAGARRAADPRAAIAALLDPGFDPRDRGGTARQRPGLAGRPAGAARMVREGIEALDIAHRWRATRLGRRAAGVAAALARERGRPPG